MSKELRDNGVTISLRVDRVIFEDVCKSGQGVIVYYRDPVMQILTDWVREQELIEQQRKSRYEYLPEYDLWKKIETKEGAP